MTTIAFRDIKVPTPGYGAMSLAGAYGAAESEAESLKVLKKALDLGCTFWDTAAVYGFGSNEELIGKFLKHNLGAREKLFIASKCAFEIDFENKKVAKITNSREHITRYLEDSTRRLGTAPDLYYLHRRDPNTPLSESISTLDELRKQGKCKYIGLSECSAKTLREACAIAQVDAIQIEYSPFCLVPEENGLLETAKELGVTVVAFSPLGVGFLTAKYDNPDQFNNDMRSQAGRFQGENFETNLKMVEKLRGIADKKGCTPGQLALAWCAAQGTIPIPGTRRAERVEENFGATNVEITKEDLEEIREVIKGGPKGSRWSQGIMNDMGK